METEKIYPVIVKEFNDEDGHYFVATSPAIDGMVTQGVTFDETVHNAKDAIETALEGLGRLPDGKFNFDRTLEPTEKLIYISVNLMGFYQKYGKTVRKSITVPEYLSLWAKENHINLSRVASDALRGLQEQSN